MGCGSSQDAINPSATKPAPAPNAIEARTIKVEPKEGTQHKGNEQIEEIKPLSAIESGNKAKKPEPNENLEPIPVLATDNDEAIQPVDSEKN